MLSNDFNSSSVNPRERNDVTSFNQEPISSLSTAIQAKSSNNCNVLEEWKDGKFIGEPKTVDSWTGDPVENFFGFDLRVSNLDKAGISPGLVRIVKILSRYVGWRWWRIVARSLGVHPVVLISAEYIFEECYHGKMKYVLTVWAKSQKFVPFHTTCALTMKALTQIGREDLICVLKGDLKEPWPPSFFDSQSRCKC